MNEAGFDLIAAPSSSHHGAEAGAPSKSIVPRPPSVSYETASWPNVKPNFFALPSCFRKRDSTADCGSGQAMRVPAIGPIETPKEEPAQDDDTTGWKAAREFIGMWKDGTPGESVGEDHDKYIYGRK